MYPGGMSARKPYPSDLTALQWDDIEHLFPRPKSAVRPPVVPLGVGEVGEQHLVHADGGRGGGTGLERGGGEFELQRGEGGVGLGRVVLAGEQLLVADVEGIGPDGAARPDWV